MKKLINIFAALYLLLTGVTAADLTIIFKVDSGRSYIPK